MNKRILMSMAALTAAGGLALGAASLASADESTPTPTTSTTDAPRGMGNGNTDPSKPMRSDEQLLTGDAASKVTAAAKAKEPDATIERVETDSDGVYEAHMVRSDGTHITVQVDKDFAVTNVQEMGQARHGGPSGSDDSNGSNGTDGSTSSATSTS